jgi:hypothetical protein
VFALVPAATAVAWCSVRYIQPKTLTGECFGLHPQPATVAGLKRCKSTVFAPVLEGAGTLNRGVLLAVVRAAAISPERGIYESVGTTPDTFEGLVM